LAAGLCSDPLREYPRFLAGLMGWAPEIRWKEEERGEVKG